MVLVLQKRRRQLTTRRLWTAVFVANVVGTLAFAALTTLSGAVETTVIDQLGTTAVQHPLSHVFTSAILGGVLIAFMAWMVADARNASGQITVVWLMIFPVDMLNLAHCIAPSGYILAASLTAPVAVGAYAA